MANMHVENETFSLVKKNFREINSLVTSLVDKLLSRNFTLTTSSWGFSFRFTLWKLQTFTLTEKKFRQINYLVISIVKPLHTFTKFLPKKRESKFP